MNANCTKTTVVSRFAFNNLFKTTYWSAQELVTIGVFAAVIKVSTLLVALMGGGMNPLTLVAKNCLFIMLLVVLLHKVPRLGTLTLVNLIHILVSFLLMGQGMLSIPAIVVVCLLAEGLIYIAGGYKKLSALLLGIIFADFASKGVSLLLSYLAVREQGGMILMAALFVMIGSFGSLIGLYCGVRFTKELRHAGLISA